ncbi:hypothetical protein [Kocuria aegyptia]|uniref:STAS domain-containing protein n=1 Tax=Kocuria aegyptia TaxID=330943 RepID=A0ABN2KKT5_9MICC
MVSLLAICAVVVYSGTPVQQQAAASSPEEKAAAVDHKLSVTVQVDLDGRTIRILATGCLTDASQRALHPLLRRARSLTPGIHVTVDLTGARHVEATGVQLLRWATHHDGADGWRPVEFLLPDPLPDPAWSHGHGVRTTSTTPSCEVRDPEVTDTRGRDSLPQYSTTVVSAHAAP